MANHQTTYKAVNHDQWTMFLVFSKTIDVDFKDFDGNGAWPVMLDDFVAFMKDKKQVSSF
jgi:DCN1-like protein 1/2